MKDNLRKACLLCKKLAKPKPHTHMLSIQKAARPKKNLCLPQSNVRKPKVYTCLHKMLKKKTTETYVLFCIRTKKNKKNYPYEVPTTRKA